MDRKKNITKAAGLVSLATFISRVLGFARDVVFAFFFGATGFSDTFVVAFRIPNLLRELLAEGSMSSAFIPVLTEYQNTRGAEEAKRLVRITFTFIMIFVGCICVLGAIFAPAIVTTIAPGFIGRPEKFTLTVMLTRIMSPFLLFISLSALVMGVLNTRRIFFIPAFAPALMNVTIICTMILFARRLDNAVVSVAIGVLLGGFIQFLFQMPSFFRSGYDIRPGYDFRHPGLKKMSLLILPATMGMAVVQINVVVSTMLASYLPEGSITYLTYSLHLIQFPVGVFGVAMGTAVLPMLSEHAVKGEMEKLREDFSFAIRLLFFITIPAMAGLIALREPIVNMLFQRGKFDYAATLGTSEALLFYSFGIWAIVGVRIVTAGFYSMQDTKTPVKIAVVAVITNIVFSIILMKPLKHSGLAFANAIASSVNFFLLFYFLRRKLKRIEAGRIIRSFLKVCIAAVFMGLSGWALLHGELWQLHGRSIEKAFYLSGVIVLCACIYFFLSYLLKSEEMEYVLGLLRRKLKWGE